MVAAGISSILNFAPTVIAVPDGVDVRKVDLSIELQILAYHEQRKAPRSDRHERPRRRHLPQQRPGEPARAGGAGRRRRAQARPEGRRERARHRGDRDRDLQPGRDLRRGRPVPRLGRGALDAARRAGRRLDRGDAAAPLRPLRRRRGRRTCSRSRPASTRWRSARARSSARPATRSGSARSSAPSGPALNVLFQQALRVGKRSRAETDIDRVAPTLVSAALDHAEAVTRPSRARRSAPAPWPAWPRPPSRASAPRSVTVVNRTPDRAQRLAEEYAATSATLADLPAALAEADVVIACAGASGVLVTRAMVEQARDRRAADDVHRPRAAARHRPRRGRAARRRPPRPRRPRRGAARVRGRP